MLSTRLLRTWLAIPASVLVVCGQAFGAVSVEILKTDLEPLIRKAAQTPVQFAVHVPHAVSTKTAGDWSTNAERATWQYAVQVPTAVSMSFHAVRAEFPESATLTVRGSSTTVTYRASDMKYGALWSRIQPGDTLEFTLDVAEAERPQVVFEILSLQAGYRALGSGARDHSEFRRLRAMSAVAADECVENYECHVSAANTPAARATVGVVIGNRYQCTGTLLNNVPGDNTPFVLTARHCQQGEVAGGNPGAASTARVYWNATTPCGNTLGTLYDPDVVTQQGATTIVEQQDAWLIRLNQSPVVGNAYFAGFDATGGPVQGGYTVQHSLGYNKQYTEWFGQAFAVTRPAGLLGAPYISDFLDVVNQLGTFGPGASGSGLMDQNHRLVGSLSLGRLADDESPYSACPAPNPQVPNSANGVGSFTSLSAIWSSTADPSSTTGTTTLASVLDPASTGTKVTSSAPAVSMTFTSSVYFRTINEPAQLTWNAPGASQCTATGGTSGDGWSGTLPASGTRSVTATSPAEVAYQLSCALPQGRTVRASLSITWRTPAPQLTLRGPEFPFLWTTRPAVLTWASNVAPCSLTGGSLSLTNLDASGTTTTTQSAAGDVTYQMTCGTPGNAITAQTTVSYETPSLLFLPNGTDRRMGEKFELNWRTRGESCVTSGGAPGDGWGNRAFRTVGHPQFALPRVSAPGTYTYTLTCASGPISIQQSVEVRFANDTPFVDASISRTSATYSATPADDIELSWNSNFSDCFPESTPVFGMPVGTHPIHHSVHWAKDSATLSPRQPGTYELKITCWSSPSAGQGRISSSPFTVTILPPPAPTVTMTTSASTIGIGQSVTLNWSSAHAHQCLQTGSGGAVGIVWGGGSGSTPSGTKTLGTTGPGTVTLGLSCESIDEAQAGANAEVTLDVRPPTATLSASATSVNTGQTFTLTWSSTFADACTASSTGLAGSSWSGPLAASGSVTQTASAVGTAGYTVTCGTSFPASAQTTVTVSAAPGSAGSGGSGGGGGGGGGGALSATEIGVLLMLLLTAMRPGRIRWKPGRH